MNERTQQVIMERHIKMGFYLACITGHFSQGLSNDMWQYKPLDTVSYI
jgi:hypothetical protein